MDFCIKYRFINRHDGLTKNLCEGRGILKMVRLNCHFIYRISIYNRYCMSKHFEPLQGKRVQKTQIAQQTKLTP